MSHDEVFPLTALKTVLGKTNKQVIKWLDDHGIRIHKMRGQQMIARADLRSKPGMLEKIDKAVAKARATA